MLPGPLLPVGLMIVVMLGCILPFVYVPGQAILTPIFDTIKDWQGLLGALATIGAGAFAFKVVRDQMAQDKREAARSRIWDAYREAKNALDSCIEGLSGVDDGISVVRRFIDNYRSGKWLPESYQRDINFLRDLGSYGPIVNASSNATPLARLFISMTVRIIDDFANRTKELSDAVLKDGFPKENVQRPLIDGMQKFLNLLESYSQGLTEERDRLFARASVLEHKLRELGEDESLLTRF